MSLRNIFIGTSGWYYEHWKEIFYPKDIASEARLKFYSENFDTVEINNTFYHLPKKETVTNWKLKVPKNFVFSVKASGYITHRKRLKDPEQTLKYFFEVISNFKNKLGPILFQLPPSFQKDTERLINFIAHLKKDLEYVFEFRHNSWFDEEIFTILNKNSIAICISDLKEHPSPDIITADFTYIRLHGPTKKAYAGSYGSKELLSWKDKIENWNKQKIKIYCYFDNDEKSYAVQNAKQLRQLLNIDSK